MRRQLQFLKCLLSPLKSAPGSIVVPWGIHPIVRPSPTFRLLDCRGATPEISQLRSGWLVSRQTNHFPRPEWTPDFPFRTPHSPFRTEKARRAGIFVVSRSPNEKAPFRSDIACICEFRQSSRVTFHGHGNGSSLSQGSGAKPRFGPG
jgi:hypothetical protein